MKTTTTTFTVEDCDQDMLDELRLAAENDGDAYRDDKNAAAAVERAFAEYQRNKRQAERDDFVIARKTLVAELAARWKGGAPAPAPATADIVCYQTGKLLRRSTPDEWADYRSKGHADSGEGVVSGERYGYDFTVYMTGEG